jgi:hypothetical protein
VPPCVCAGRRLSARRFFISGRSVIPGGTCSAFRNLWRCFRSVMHCTTTPFFVRGMSGGIARVQWRSDLITEYKTFPETPLCPKCKKAMTVSDVMSMMPTTGLDQDEVVYKCRRCGAEKKQILDRHRAESIILGQ